MRGGPWQEKKKMDTVASGLGYISPVRVFFPMCLSTVEWPLSVFTENKDQVVLFTAHAIKSPPCWTRQNTTKIVPKIFISTVCLF